MYANLRDLEDDGRLDPRRSWSCISRLSEQQGLRDRTVRGGRRDVGAIAPPENAFLWVDPRGSAPLPTRNSPSRRCRCPRSSSRRSLVASRPRNPRDARDARANRTPSDNSPGSNSPRAPRCRAEANPGSSSRPDAEPVADELEGGWYLMSSNARVYSRPFGTPGPTGPNCPRAWPCWSSDSRTARPGQHGQGLVSFVASSKSTTASRWTVTRRVLAHRTSDAERWVAATMVDRTLRAYQMFELEGGETLRVTDRFESSGRQWLLVEPPRQASLFVRGGEIRPASAGRSPRSSRPHPPNLVAEPVAAEPEVAEPVAPSPRSPNPSPPSPRSPNPSPPSPRSPNPSPPSPRSPNPSPPSPRSRTRRRRARGRRTRRRRARSAVESRPITVVPPPAPDQLEERTARVMFPDGVPGTHKAIRAPGRAFAPAPTPSTRTRSSN